MYSRPAQPAGRTLCEIGAGAPVVLTDAAASGEIAASQLEEIYDQGADPKWPMDANGAHQDGLRAVYLAGKRATNAESHGQTQRPQTPRSPPRQSIPDILTQSADLVTRCWQCHKLRYFDVNNEGRYVDDVWQCDQCVKRMEPENELDRVRRDLAYTQKLLELARSREKQTKAAYDELVQRLAHNITQDAQ